jgi:hypothetical protein
MINKRYFLNNFFKMDSDKRSLADRELKNLSMPEVSKLITMEVQGQRKSKSVLRRLHQRFTRLRAEAEAEKLAQNRTNWRL